MKNLSLFIFLLVIGKPVIAQNSDLDKTLTINFNNITVVEAFETMKASGINIAYNSNILNSQKINHAFQNKSVDYILKTIIKNTNLSFKLVGETITIYPKKASLKRVISGKICDSETGEVLIGAKIMETSNGLAVPSNQFGFFSLNLLAINPDFIFSFSYIGYKPKTKIIKAFDTTLVVYLEPKNTEINAIVVTSEKNLTETASFGKINLSSDEIKSIPAIGGETDVLKAIALLPGIKQGVDGSAGFYVRGGGPDQNLILLDGVPIYNPYHLWGMLSSFNADAINNIEVTKGAFPARYGGRISSVLDITMNNGNNKKWEKSLSVGLLSAKASISGPLIKDKSSIMLTARRTYADLLIVPIVAVTRREKGFKRNEGYNFTDLNLKLNYKISPRDHVYVSGFLSRDRYYLNQSENYEESGLKIESESKRNMGWGNQIGSVRWNHIFGQKLFLSTTGYVSSYKYYTGDFGQTIGQSADQTIKKESSIDYFSLVTDYAIKQDYQYSLFKNHTLRFGYGLIYHQFKPGINSFFTETDGVTINNSNQNSSIYATELMGYIEDEFKVGSRLFVNTGIHVSGFLVNETTYHSLQPRLGFNYKLTENLAFKTGFAQMTQYLHLLTSSGITQSSDLWVPVTDKIKPQDSWLVSAGLAYNFQKNYQLELEGYYKKMTNLIDYKNGASFLNSAVNWESKVESGQGESYGGELFIRKTKGKLTGWLGYTLSWSNRQFENINFGNPYPYRYDRRHDISLVGSYKLNEKWAFNGSWVFYTGNAVTLPTYSYITPAYNNPVSLINTYPDPNTISVSNNPPLIVTTATSRNNFRLPNYHRMDLTATYTKQKEWGEWVMNFGITNIYNRLNPSFFYTQNLVDKTTGVVETNYFQRTLFPFMPTFNYQINF